MIGSLVHQENEILRSDKRPSFSKSLLKHTAMMFRLSLFKACLISSNGIAFSSGALIGIRSVCKTT